MYLVGIFRLRDSFYKNVLTLFVGVTSDHQNFDAIHIEFTLAFRRHEVSVYAV